MINILTNGWKEKLVNVLISPYILALPVAAIIIYFIPKIERFKADIVKTGISDKVNCYEIFYDLDTDGFSEKIILFNSQKNEAAIKIIDHTDAMIGWYDFHGFISNYPPVTGDVDHNGKPEIYFMSNHEDSLILCILSCTKYPAFVCHKHFIDRTLLKGNSSDYTIGNVSFTDLQLDGNDEVMFSVFAGYSLQPRRLYAYDTSNDTVLMGPLMGCQTYFVQTQLDDDPYVEFIGNSSSTGNMPPGLKIPYTDSSAWLMALDHQLKYIFDPIEYKGHKTYLGAKPLTIGNSTKIITLFDFASNMAINPELAIYDNKGKLLKKKELSKPGGKDYYSLAQDRNNPSPEIILKDGSGRFYIVDSLLNFQLLNTLGENFACDYTSFDVDDDGSLENIFLCSKYEGIYITREDFSYPVYVKIPFDRVTSQISIQKNGHLPALLFIQRGEKEYWVRYQRNVLWYAKFPIWLGIYFLILGFIYVVRRFQIIQQKKLKAREDQLAQLQLETVSTYLDPHFTFNTLNTITGLIYKEEKIKAHQIITRFTTLIQTTLVQSGKVGRSLSEELDFVKDYLDIQKLRFGNIFTWEITVDENVDLTQIVPKMLVQVYAENAIKHGLKNKGAGGKLDIIIHQARETTVTIRDNGIGREKARMNAEPGTGKGLYIMQQIFDLFGKTNKRRITQTISDLKDDSGNPTGTEVVLTIRKT